MTKLLILTQAFQLTKDKKQVFTQMVSILLGWALIILNDLAKEAS